MTSANPESPLIRPTEAARLLGITKQTVHRYLESGYLTGVRLPGGARRIHRESVEKFLEDNRA